MDEKPKVKIKRGSPRPSENQNWWPYLLIGIGVLFLLGNLGVIAGLFRLWPLILIGIGLMLLFNRTGGSRVKHEHFSAPVESATSARVKLDLSLSDTNVKAVSTPDTLIDAELAFIGEVEFAVSGDQEKIVSLGNAYNEWLNPANWRLFGPWEAMRWEVGLNPNIPLDLDIHCGLGRALLDLSNLHLTDLDVSGGVGEMELNLSSKGDHYNGRLKIGVGAFKLNIPSGTSADLQVRGGVGECVITLPADSAVRIRGRMGLGEVNMPARLTRVSGSNGDFVSQSGVWETSDFASAERKIVIDFDGGVGSLRVR
jgi:hypothetical protein